MCGIVGILNLKSSASIEEPLLTRMRDQMIHRGPDSAGTWISNDRHIGLAHRRLKIIDLSEAAHQPMSNEDGTVWITFNGEIYNHLELRKQLEAKGHRYRSHSDTETIVHAYEEWGEEAIQKIDGMFAFGIWDEKKKQLLLARDRLGKKPLYFTESNGKFLFASEIKAILEHPDIRRSVNEEALWHYLTFASTPAPLTLFDGIFKLPPATSLLISDKSKCLKEYWRPWSSTDKPAHSKEAYISKIQETLKNAVDRRLMSDVPFGVFLSGGVDSSTNVALMSQLMDRPVDTFSVGFEDQAQAPYNEIQYARKVAKLFKTNHHEILIADHHFFDFVDRMAFYQDEPVSDPVCFPLYYVSKLARQNGTIVIQVGEGSDEIFAGYEIYRNYVRRHHSYWKKFQALPAPIQKAAALVGKGVLKQRHATQLKRASRGEPVFVTAALAFHDDEKRDLRSWQHPYSSSGLAAESYVGTNPSFAIAQRVLPSMEIKMLPPFAYEEEGENEHDYLKLMIQWECHQRLSELLLMRLDKMMMANSIEGRAPFLDTQLVQLAMQIPSSLKIQRGVGKAILKQAVEPILPRELIYREKIGFCGGSHNMLTPGIFKFAKSTILETLPKHGWDKSSLETIFKTHEQKKAEQSYQIWGLMNLSLWLKQWF